jgi:hypothetical protein
MRNGKGGHGNGADSLTCRSNGVLASPFTGRRLVPWAVSLVDMCDFGHERVVGVGVCEHGANGKQHLRDCQGGTPLITQDVETNAAVGVDVGVINTGGEVDLRGLEWVIGREMD